MLNRWIIVLFVSFKFFAHTPAFGQAPAADVALKTRAVRTVEAQSAQLISLSDQVWRFAETALKETKFARSSKSASGTPRFELNW